MKKHAKKAGWADGACERSEPTQWPFQLHLIAPHAPYFQGADLLVAADCTAFTYANLVQLFASSQLRSVTVARMTVPCCGGLSRLVEKALEIAGVGTPVRTVVIGLSGEVVSEG